MPAPAARPFLRRLAAALLLAATLALPAAAQAPGPYHGNVQSRVFHAPGCRYYDCKNCKELFKTREEAVKAGYRPCQVCRP